MDTIRNIHSADYHAIITKLDNWWGGRRMTDMLPKLFFNHFSNTSFIIHNEELIKGFLIGFISQADSIGYVHFVGVNPEYREQGIGKGLYRLFFDKLKKLGVPEVECVTSPINETSIRFHKKLGFSIQSGDCVNENGISFRKNYDGPGEDRVVFRRKIA